MIEGGNEQRLCRYNMLISFPKKIARVINKANTNKQDKERYSMQQQE
jgi:hypothetical protein